MTILKALYIDLKVRSGIACTEPDYMFLDIVIKKGMAFMYIKSISDVISLYCSGIGICFSSSFPFEGT